MTEPETHRAPSAELVALARSHVQDGTIREPETPALLRRVANASPGVEIAVTVVVVTAVPLVDLPRDDFALVEYEARPGVRNYRLARLPRNDGRLVRLGAFERAFHRTCVLLVRRVLGAFRAPAPLSPVPDPAARLRAAGPGRVALLPRPSGC